MQQAEAVRRDARYGLQRFARTREEFIQLYDTEFKDVVEELEAKRKVHMGRLRQMAILLIIGLIFAVIFLKSVIVLILILGAPPIIQYYRSNKRKMDDELRKRVIPSLVQFMNPSFTYEPRKHLPLKEFQYANFFNHGYSRYRGEDLIRGEVVDEAMNWRTSVAFSEIQLVHLAASKDRDGKTTVSEGSDIVRGLFYKVDFNKDFGDTVTTIVPRLIMKSRLLRSNMVDFQKLGMEEVELEDLAFMDEFAVYSNDQIMSRVILQPDTMDQLRHFIQNKPVQLNGEPEVEIAPTDFSFTAIKHILKQTAKGELYPYVPYLTFKHNQLYLLYSTAKDHFAFHMFYPFTAESLYSYFKDMNRGLQLIDQLHLNLKLYVD